MKASALRFFIKQAVRRPELVPPMVRGVAKVYRHDPAKGILTGLAGGLVGTIVMTEFQRTWSKASAAMESRTSGNAGKAKEKEDSTMRAADKIARLAGRQLSKEEKRSTGCCCIMPSEPR